MDFAINKSIHSMTIINYHQLESIIGNFEIILMYSSSMKYDFNLYDQSEQIEVSLILQFTKSKDCFQRVINCKFI